MDVYCSDREKGRSIKEDILKDTGVKVRRVVRSLDRLRDSEGVILFVYDDNLDIDYDFKDNDIVVSMYKMNFNDWIAFSRRGVDIVDCSEGFGEIAWRLVYEGVEGAKANDRANRSKLEEKKYELKDYFRQSGLKLVNVVSTQLCKSKSNISMNYANMLKNENPTKRVVVIDRVKGFTGINYLVNNHKDYEKVDTKNSQLGDDIYRDKERDVFVMSPSNIGKNYKDVGVTDIVSIIDNIKRHFDIIIVDTDTLIDGDFMTIADICTDNIVVTERSTEGIETTAKYLENNRDIIKDNVVIVVDNGEGTGGGITHSKIETYGKVVELPNDVEDAKQKGYGVYLVEVNSEIYNVLKNINTER